MKPLKAIQLSFSCPKAVDELIPCNDGWYCNGCHKVVHDLRGMPENEIMNIFNSNGKNLCGMFEADRIRVGAPLPKWRKCLAAAVLALGFTGVHHHVSAQQIQKGTINKDSTTTDLNEIFGVVESSAQFPGDVKKLRKFISENLIPDTSCHAGQKALFMFYVEIDGRLTYIKAFRSPFSELMNKRIIAMLQKSPRWMPGTQLGKPVRQLYTLPITPIAK